MDVRYILLNVLPLRNVCKQKICTLLYNSYSNYTWQVRISADTSGCKLFVDLLSPFRNFLIVGLRPTFRKKYSLQS
jgi:hypothetical protein